jgi:putative addiction module component (TIGR02574 family)
VDVNQALSELTALPVADRLRVVESLWDSIESETRVPLSPDQRAELDRRVRAHETNPDDLLSWDQVQERLRTRNR